MSLPAFDALAVRLLDRARALAEASAQMRRNPLRAWRDARLVWPLFPPTNRGD